MKVAVGIPVLYNFEGLARLLHSISGHEFTLYIQDNWESNIGVAAAWNRFIDKAIQDDIDLLIIANDDVTFHPGSYDKVINLWQSRPEDCVVLTAHNSGPETYEWNAEAYDFCCFALDPKDALDKVGYFDHHNFKPAYFEDNDYLYRIKLAGYKHYIHGDFWVHHEGSKTQFWNGPDNGVVSHDMFRANQDRYVKKWGGQPGNETYNTPFNK